MHDSEIVLQHTAKEGKHEHSKQTEYIFIAVGATLFFVGALLESYLFSAFMVIATVFLVIVSRKESRNVVFTITNDCIMFGQEKIKLETITSYQILDVIGKTAKLFLCEGNSLIKRHIVSIEDGDINFIHDFFTMKEIPQNENLKFTWLDKLTFYF